MTIQEMREARAKKWESAKDFLDTHKTSRGTLSALDEEIYNRMEQEVNDLGREIKRAENRERIDAEMSKPTTAPLRSNPFALSKDSRATDEYRSAMLDAFRSNFKRVSNVLQEQVDADGGYLVPAEWDERLINTLETENIMRNLGTVITTTGEHKINIAATKPAALWVEEGGELTWGDATFGQVILDAHKLHVAVKVTEELLYDNAFNLENYLIDEFGKAIANAEEDAFLNGDGSGTPTGIFDATAGGTVYNTVAEVDGDSLIDLVYALKRPYRKNAAFVMNDATIAAVRKLKDDNGMYIWQPAYSADEPDTLLGYPVYTSAYAPTTGIAFGDYSYYNIGDRGTRSFAELRELFAGNGMIGYLMKERVDGKLVLPEAVQVLTIGG